MGKMSLRKIHRYKTNIMNIVELIKECPKYTKLYTITHGEVLLDHVKDNCIVVITKTSNGFTKCLKLDELGRLSEHGQTVLFPSTSGTWDEFDITEIEINSPFVPGQVAYNKEPKAKEYLKRFFGIEEKPKYEFKPFDKVLVKNDESDRWCISFFSREIVDGSDGSSCEYECSNGTLWNCCIPFEGNEYLLGTAENPEK